MLQLRGVIGGVEHTVALDRPETTLGRADDNDVVLADRVSSAHHAVVLHDGDRWWIRDLESRYGLRVNDDVADEAALHPGDVVTIGTVDFLVELDEDARGGPGRDETEALPEDGGADSSEGLLTGLSRPVADFAESLGLSPADEAPPAPEAAGTAGADSMATGTEADHGYSGLAVGYLTRLAHELRTASDIDEAARQTLDVAFHALGVERGWILFTDTDGEVVERVARIGDRVHHPDGALPLSMSIVRKVLADRASLATGDVTLDAQAASRSMLAHDIRAAMCAPLWSGDEVSGVLYVDTLVTHGPFSAAALDLLTAMANNLAVAVRALRLAQDAEREREVRRYLERYHSPTMIDALQHSEVAEDTSALRQADVTVLFADLVGFTAASQQLSPAGVARLLDGFFTEAVEAVFDHGGTLDKFIGDAVMAFFGAPVPSHDHAEQALRAALDLRFRLSRWNRRQIEAGGRPVEIRVALNSGPVVVGDVGSSRRVDYTVLGNTVNVAARLESVGAPGDIVLGPGTRERLPADFPLAFVGDIDLKGLRHPLPVWKVATQPT